MSDALPPLWPRDTRPPAVPGCSPSRRHQPPPGLAAGDWLLRHRFAQRRETAFLAAALAAPAAAAAPLVAGDIGVAAARSAFVASCGAAGIAPDTVLLRRVLALLRGCYVVMPAEDRLTTVAVAAAVAARCGVSVHLACAEKAGVESVLAQVNAALAGHDVQAVAPADNAADFRLLTGEAARVVCAPASTLAHAWLRWNGDQGSASRAAAWLGGDPAPVFSFAALLLAPDGDYVLLDLPRHPLQITRPQAEDATALMADLVALTAEWQEGREFVDDQLLPPGKAALQGAAAQRGGLWAVPMLLDGYAMSLLIARTCVVDRDFTLAEGRLRWLVLPEALADDAMRKAQVELALRCLQGQPAPPRVHRRAWFADFFAGYARIGATGANLADEWRDLWWLYAMPVLDNAPRLLAVEWVQRVEQVTAAEERMAVSQSSQLGLPGLPADIINLESRDDARQAADLHASGTPLRVLGPIAACRHLPPSLSSIILAADARLMPAASAALAQLALRWGRPGQWLLRLIGRWELRRAANLRFARRRQLVQRRLVEQRTYAFIGDSRDE